MEPYIQLELPFAGFYGSHIDAEVQSAVENEIEYYENDAKQDLEEGEISENLKRLENWGYSKEAMEIICKDYTDYVASELGITMRFVKVVSPKFYNFETDRIIVEVLSSELPKLTDELKEKLIDKSNKWYTSYDGFMSFVNPDITPMFSLPYRDWDEPYLDVLMACLCMDRFGGEHHSGGDVSGYVTDMELLRIEDGGYEVVYEAVNI